MRNFNIFEFIGITHGLGAMQTAKRIRRLQEGQVRVPLAKDWIEKDEEAQVARVNKYFDDILPTETIDGTPESNSE
jgi:hypothetical protein